MAAKSKRLFRHDNKLLKLNKLQINDVLCSICQSILVEPVTLPCYHDFCHSCFNGSVENNALCCPLCRLRIGSWLRTATKQKNLVNAQLWSFMKIKFEKEIKKKLEGEEVIIAEESPAPRLSAPGEIRQEYEKELKRLQTERIQLEQKHLQDTELLVKKIQKEEEEANAKYLERLKEDELLAQQIQTSNSRRAAACNSTSYSNRTTKGCGTKLKPTKLDAFIVKKTPLPKARHTSPILTDDNTSTDSSTPKTENNSSKHATKPSPELVPSYGSFLKSFLDKKIRNVTGLWNKENGGTITKKESPTVNQKDSDMQTTDMKSNNRTPKKCRVQSLPVSLPYKGILQSKHKSTAADTDSVDSMRQELCYFKPIETISTASGKSSLCVPVKIPGVRASSEGSPLTARSAPTRAEYVDGFCQLRKSSLEQDLPSAFVLALKILQVKQDSPPKKECSLKIKIKKQIVSSHCNGQTLTLKKNHFIVKDNEDDEVDGITKLQNKKVLRRTRSMGSITRNINETTPKKAKTNRKVSSERKPRLRSNSKKSSAQKLSPSLVTEPVYDSQKIDSVVKNLSSPLKNCDVKIILEEQMRIEKLIEQEQTDLELARRMDAEWNGGRRLRHTAKRHLALGHALARPNKKLKV